jgi:hypothetical protein
MAAKEKAPKASFPQLTPSEGAIVARCHQNVTIHEAMAIFV